MFILKQLRRKKNVNQSDLAEAIGVSLRTIQLYEKKDANIPIKNLTKIAQYFDVSIAELFSHESVNETGEIYKEVGSRTDKIHTIRKLGPGKYLVSVPLVVVEAYENYVQQYHSSVYMQSLPQISFALDQVSVNQYMAFEISNDSMDDGTIDRIPKKAIIFGKLVSKNKLQKKLKDNSNTYWIIVYENGIMCKEITSYSIKDKTVSCHSLKNSPEYSDFEMPLEEAKQFFEIIKKQI